MLVASVFLCLVLAALLWAAKVHEETLQNLPGDLARELRPFLLEKDLQNVHLGAIEQRVNGLIQGNRYIESLILRKVTVAGESHTVYPFFYDFEHPDFPPASDNSYEYQPILDENGDHLGDLYVKIDTRRRQLYFAAILGSIFLILLVCGLGLYALQSKTEEVRKTSTLLEEKQRELTHLERLAMVGQITANLLHDLKKPVLNIRAETASLPDGPIKASLQEETDLFLSLVRDLHLEGFLRKQGERAEFLDLNEMVDRSLRLVKYAQENVKILLELPETLPFIFGQRRQLIQVISNILLNAFQALEGEGAIHVTASLLDENDVKWLEISFTDDGPGIPYDVLTHIFEPFYSTRPESESTGLGLYITKSIVESMGGRIQAHSIPKHGTTFTLQFPLSQEEVV